MSIRELFVEAKMILEEDLSLDTLLRQHGKLSEQRELDEQTQKLLAEVCFLIAREYLGQQEREKARQFAEQSIGLYRQIDTNTLRSALPILARALPDRKGSGKSHL